VTDVLHGNTLTEKYGLKKRGRVTSGVTSPCAFNERAWYLKEKPRLSGAFNGADDGARTRDPQLGKLMLYQLSYVRARIILSPEATILIGR
jgi:hypothetical protein